MSASIRSRIAVLSAFMLALDAISLRADQLQMQNGDRYAGKILSVNSNSIVFQSDVLGKVTLPRDKVSTMMFGTTAGTNAVHAAPKISTSAVASPNASVTNSDLSAALRGLGADTNFIQQVRQQMLTGANPAASQKYDELVGGLMTGKLDVNDIRNEAKASIEQIHELKRELGPEAGDSLDSYLTILESFVNETAPTPASGHFSTNSPAASPGN